MPDVNIPAVASGAFLGFLALLGIVACVPPVTRFLGDLFCCPWRMPFTKEKRRNGDEEMEQTDFPYLTGKHGSEQHIDTPGHYRESNRMSAAYMSAVSLVDPEHAKEEWTRSAEYRRSGEYRMGTPPNHQPYPAGYYNSGEMSMHPTAGYESPQHQHLQVPAQQYGNWRQPSPDRQMMQQQQQRSADGSPDRVNNYHAPGPQDQVEDYSPEHYPNEQHYDENYVDVQRPQPSHVHTPTDVQPHSYSHGYFPQPEWEQEDYAHQHSQNRAYANNASSERLMGPPRQQ